MNKLQYESLHNHTVISDGTQTHLQALAAAEASSIGVMAFTDHDTLPNEAAMQALRGYNGPVRWTVGVELSSFVPLEVGGPEKGAMHVLGLFVDAANRPLIDFCERASEGRRRRMRMILEHLQEHGFEVSEAEVERQATSSNIVLPHIVKAVMTRPENRARMDALREQMRQESEHNAELKKQYDRMIDDGPRQYPYQLVMTRHAYVPMEKQEISTLLDMDATVRLIREAGGIAVLAHWFLDEHKLSEAALVRVLERGGLDGLETVGINTIGQRDLSTETERTRMLVRRFGVAEVMGSDSHSAADLAAFAASHYAAESVGQTERLIERFKPSLRWGNLE